LANSNGKEFYVFPYVEEEDPAEKIITFAKIMNHDLDLMEYIEFWNYE